MDWGDTSEEKRITWPLCPFTDPSLPITHTCLSFTNSLDFNTHTLQSLTKVVLPVWFQAFDLITAIHVLWPTAHSSFWVLSNSFEDCLPDLLLGLDDYFGFALVCLTALQFSSNSCIQISTSHLTIRLKLWQLWYLFKVIKGFANFSLEILV